MCFGTSGCLTILPCRHPSSSGGLRLLDHAERDSELPLNLLFSLGDITVGMKGLNSQPSLELQLGEGPAPSI